jgi:hypothetical protein
MRLCAANGVAHAKVDGQGVCLVPGILNFLGIVDRALRSLTPARRKGAPFPQKDERHA